MSTPEQNGPSVRESAAAILGVLSLCLCPVVGSAAAIVLGWGQRHAFALVGSILGWLSLGLWFALALFGLAALLGSESHGF